MGRPSKSRTIAITFSSLALCGALWMSPLQAADLSSRYQNAKAELDKGEFDLAIGQFRELQKDDATSPYAIQAQLEIAYAYYRMGDSEQVVATLKEFRQQHSDHPHIPYSHYLAGLSLYEDALRLIENSSTKEGRIRAKVSAQQALTYFSRLINDFPKSKYAADARVKTTQLLEKMVLAQMEQRAEPQAVTSNVVPVKGVAKDNEWLLQQRGDQFTLQLMSSPRKQEIHRVIAEHNLPEHSMIQHSKTAGGEAFHLLYGLYPNKSLAMEVGAGLPPAILATRPWVREISAVQTEIRQQRIELAKQQLSSKTAQPQAVTAETRPASRAQQSQPGNITSSLGGKTDASDWLMQQPAGNLAIQLTGMADPARVDRFFAEHPLGEELRHFKAQRHDQAWYSVIYGNYDNKQAALAALSELKQKTGINDAWLRSYRHIQDAIRNSRIQDN